MKRFYKTAEAGTAPGGHVVRLDGKVLKTPLQKSLILSEALARAVAAEWAAQGADVLPATMPMTRLANTMVDKAEGYERTQMNGEVCRYAESDLICYFAAHPADLVARQKATWEPLVDWMKSRFGISFATVSGIRYQQQSPAALAAARAAVEALDAGAFTVAQAVLSVTGSLAIALALQEGFLTAAEAFHAATIDEVYQLEKWGEDAQARARLDKMREELETIAAFKASL